MARAYAAVAVRVARMQAVRWLMVLTLGASGAAVASVPRTVEGIPFEASAAVQGQQLVLNGAGLRAMMIVKVYAIALYLPRADTAAAAVLSQGGAKRLRIVLLRQVSAERLVDNLLTGIQDNTSAAELAGLQSRLATLQTDMLKLGTARKGDAITLDFVPGAGTRISVNGQAVGADIPGEDFYRALLRIWLGERPTDRGLRQDLLGLST